MNPKKTTGLTSCILLVVISLANSANSASVPARAISIGPMLHWNFGGEKQIFSWAVEAAYWQTAGTPRYGNRYLHGVDFGIEFQGQSKRIYCEYQRGEIIYGGSVGPVMEWNESGSHFGVQGSVWGAMLAGVDLRLRYTSNHGMVFAPGAFLKLPNDLNNGDYGIRGN